MIYFTFIKYTRSTAIRANVSINDTSECHWIGYSNWTNHFKKNHNDTLQKGKTHSSKFVTITLNICVNPTHSLSFLPLIFRHGANNWLCTRADEDGDNDDGDVYGMRILPILNYRALNVTIAQRCLHIEKIKCKTLINKGWCQYIVSSRSDITKKITHNQTYDK